MSAYMNALREEATRDELLAEVERQLEEKATLTRERDEAVRGRAEAEADNAALLDAAIVVKRPGEWCVFCNAFLNIDEGPPLIHALDCIALQPHPGQALLARLRAAGANRIEIVEQFWMNVCEAASGLGGSYWQAAQQVLVEMRRTDAAWRAAGGVVQP